MALSHLFHHQLCFALFSIFSIHIFISTDVSGAKFTFLNRCDYTVWPGIYGSPELGSSGFELPSGGSLSFPAPNGWSGRFWGRTGCEFDHSGAGACATADCGSGAVGCAGNTAAPPATLAEFTLGSGGGQDFYDVSLVDGYNLPLTVEPSGGSGECGTTGCAADLNRKCPAELRSGGGASCRSACGAFGNPEYCCSGAYSTPAACKPSIYSQVFKSACPKSYSYAYDDATSTFTCTGASYVITFCPSSPSLKSASDSSPERNGTDGLESGSEPAAEEGAMSSSWLVSLAGGYSASTRVEHSCSPIFLFIVCMIFFHIIGLY